jgi:MerR family copper efflux transcriptional regulator
MTVPEIVCSLATSEVSGRLDEWRALLSRVVERAEIAGGVRLQLGPGVGAAGVADLVARELECCPFLTLGLFMSNRGTALEIRAPEGAKALVDMLVGETPPASLPAQGV